MTTTRPHPLSHLFPRLSRFYGLGFAELCAMPRWAIIAYGNELPRLAAEEQLDLIQASSYPHLTEQKQGQVHRELVDIVGVEADEVDGSTDAGAGALGGIGIKVVMEEGGGDA